MDSIAFTEQFLLREVEQMKAAGVRLHLFAAISHGIEVMGALLDRLPFKAKAQGKKRFNLALRQLFPSTYTEVGNQIDLYGQLRSHLSHSMLPAKTVRVHVDESERHLIFDEGILNINMGTFYDDYCEAVKLLLEKLTSGKMKNKKISFDNLDSLTLSN